MNKQSIDGEPSNSKQTIIQASQIDQIENRISSSSIVKALSHAPNAETALKISEKKSLQNRQVK